MQMNTHCDRCGGKGKTMEAACPHCRGRRLVHDQSSIDVDIERGMAQGDTIVMEREGEQVPDMVRGDLIFTIKQHKHPRFKRVGNNLFTELQITLEESLLGMSKKIKHLDGHEVSIKTSDNEVIQPDQWVVIKGKGMPIRNGSGYGDLHVKFKVKLPKKLTPEQ